jgi:hypothetical protein
VKRFTARTGMFHYLRHGAPALIIALSADSYFPPAFEVFGLLAGVFFL